jgi:ATP-binding cassette subfamily F protein 3
MRCVVEGQSPHDMEGESDEERDADEENGWQAKAGVVYRLVKGQLKALDGGMGQYEAIAERATRKLLKIID